MAKGGFTVQAKLFNVADIIAELKGLDYRVQKQALRKATNAATRILMWNVKKLAPVDTTTVGLTAKGLYRKSIGRKVRVSKRGNVYGLVGARQGFKTQVGVRKRTMTKPNKKGVVTKAGDPIFQDPANIGHLLEFGHGGPHPAPAKPHLRPALDSSAAQMRAEYERAVIDELNRIVAKRAQKG